MVAALVLRGIEPGAGGQGPSAGVGRQVGELGQKQRRRRRTDAGDAHEQLDLALQLGMGAQVGRDFGLERAHPCAQIVGRPAQDAARARTGRRAGLLAQRRALGHQRAARARERQQFAALGRRRAPGHQIKARGDLRQPGQHLGVEPVILAAGEQRLGKAFGLRGIDHRGGAGE